MTPGRRRAAGALMPGAARRVDTRRTAGGASGTRGRQRLACRLHVEAPEGGAMPNAIGLVDWDTVARNWWMVLLRGVVAILFGIATFAAPGLSLAALVFVWGAYALADGVLALGTAFSRRRTAPWWVLVIQGLAGIAAGVLTFVWPGITAFVLLYVIAAWA